MKRITGRATVYVDGEQMEMERGATANPGGIARDFERHHGRTYATESEEAPFVEGNIIHTKDTDVVALSAIDNATVIFKCDTGQKWVMRGAATENPVGVEAKSPIKLVGDSWEAM
ncbi:MAG: hypothetical protein C0613_08315 [Desulfobulbaceae bacterium]|nr:MAG: hypothetical protein C0613_08315 [Desulfobulbaceae bacterium]